MKKQKIIKKNQITKPNQISKKIMKVPATVKVIAILHFISAIMGVILGVSVVIFGEKFKETIENYYSFLSFSGIDTAIVLGIALTIIAIVNFFIGRGLWTGEKWARIMAILVSTIGMVQVVKVMYFQKTFSAGLPSLIIDVLIISYLLFSKDVRSAFS